MTSFNNTISHNADVLFEVFNCISVKEGKFSLRRVCKRWKEIFDRKLSNILFSKIAPRLQEKPFSFIFEKPITPENAFSSLRLFNETVLEKMGLPCRSETVITNVNDLNALQTRYNESIVALWDEVKKQIEIPQEEMPKTAEEILDWINKEENQQHLRSITGLTLNSPSISILPADIAQFTGLNKLDLIDLPINYLCVALLKAPNLKEIFIKNAPLLGTPSGFKLSPGIDLVVLAYDLDKKKPKFSINPENLQLVPFRVPESNLSVTFIIPEGKPVVLI